MNIDNIIKNHEILDKELRQALATMEKSDSIREIHERIRENQLSCPHFSVRYNWVMVNDICPYCGKYLGGAQ